jgi:hypothetical protein
MARQAIQKGRFEELREGNYNNPLLARSILL